MEFVPELELTFEAGVLAEEFPGTGGGIVEVWGSDGRVELSKTLAGAFDECPEVHKDLERRGWR